MSLELAGISNVEFYSAHYLEAILESDLKAVFDKWKMEKEEEGKRDPVDRLHALANPYFAALAQAEGENDPVKRWESARAFNAHLLEALGYPYQPSAEPLEGDEVCPVLLALQKDGRPWLWVIDTPFGKNEDEDPLSALPLTDQLPRTDPDGVLPKIDRDGPATWQEILDERLFRIDRGPRWVLALAGREAILIERSKWPQGRLLRFDWADIFRRRQRTVLRAVCGLLHRDVLAPDSGLCLHDTLDENSHKHAFAVSSDLKYGVRRAVELLGNEAVWYRREIQRKGVFDSTEFSAEKLTAECLTWLYRLLFLFYVEARGGEMGVVPMAADVYRDGYSLEGLRDLELVPLTTDSARNGYYINDSLSTLFRIINQGYPADVAQMGLTLTGDIPYHDSMRVQPLNSPLFDDSRFKVLKGVRFRNHTLQAVLQLLSLSAEKKRKSRGRISYAQLGINQLGAVYEGLLSYTGFFAAEDMYEVAAEKDCKALSGKPAAEREALKTYFVPASRINDYKQSEIVKDADGRKVVHPKGSFIFRLAGRNREKSASYYTPEVLTKCLVKYTLKELLWEEGEEDETPRRRKKTADEILKLTICEPAMGSGAFLIEAVDQLADAYLEAKQEELGETVPPDDYQREKRRVKARLATNNCYGVDRNPTAVELAKTSLWLATIYEEGKCPWFGLRLATGNSLVGARREVFKTVDVIRKGTKDAPNWLGLVPEPVPLHHGKDAPPPEVDWASWTAPPRPKGTIYHFLLPAEGMAAFDKDKVIKQLAPESVKRIKEWRKAFCKPFNKNDAKRLEQISDAVDRLFAQVVRERVLATHETSDRIRVWGEADSEKGSAQQADLLVCDQEDVAASLEDGSSAYRRLKLAMDAWCALWFWPIEEAGLLPDRATWLAQMELILKGQLTYEDVWQQQPLFAALGAEAQAARTKDVTVPVEFASSPHDVSVERLKRLKELSESFCERRSDYLKECGLADIDALIKGDPTLRAVQGVADGLHFHHWDLRFADVFSEGGGFDLVLGNPPWVKVEWDDSQVLSDDEPSLVVKKLSASVIAAMRQNILSQTSVAGNYKAEFSDVVGTQAFLNSATNYAPLEGVQTNLYKCFVALGWRIGSALGATGLLHPEGIYDDPGGGAFRTELYPRLRAHFQLINELRLFPEVAHIAKFSINVYSAKKRSSIKAAHISNLFHPSTIDRSFAHDGAGSVPGIKDADGNWELRPHRQRVVTLSEESLRAFSKLFDDENVSFLEAPLPVVHSEEALRVLSLFAEHAMRVGDLSEKYLSTELWHETNSQRDGTIKRATAYPDNVKSWILSGPHIYVATPLNKTPNENCRSHGDYTAIDLLSIGPDYFPRTNYRPACSLAEYRFRAPRLNGKPVLDYYRHVHKALVNPVIERTLVSALIPPGPGHVHVISAVASDDLNFLGHLAALTCSLPFDFIAKSSGKAGLYQTFLRRLPYPKNKMLLDRLLFRAARLNCLTSEYARFWEAVVHGRMNGDRQTSLDRRFELEATVSSCWSVSSSLRSEFERRQALVEIDVLTAMAFGMELNDLLTVYRIQFPILQQYERERRYDQHGRIVPTSKTASGNPAVSLVDLAAELKKQARFDVRAEYHPDGLNTQELREQRIRLGKREADVLGVSERCSMADLLAETEVRWSDEEHPEGRPVRLVGLRYTHPGLEPRMERVYPTPWTRCDRESDYRQAWAEFERRLGKKMPEGTPL